MLVSSYNELLVLGSLLVAILACYTALDMAGRISMAQGRAVGAPDVGGPDQCHDAKTQGHNRASQRPCQRIA